MSKSSQAAKAVPEPQGTHDVKGSLEALKRARDGVSSALQNVMNTVVRLGLAALSEMHDRELGVLLTEASRARNMEAIVLVATAMKGTANMHLTPDEAETMLGVGYNAGPDFFLVEGKNTNLADLLISAVRKVPRADGANEAMRRLIRAGVMTNSFLDKALSSDMQMSDKVAAIGLSDSVADVSAETIEALMTHLVRVLEMGSQNAEFIPHVHELVVREGGPGAGDALIQRLVSHRECVYAADVATAFPKAFDAACAAVLGSGSPEAIAMFWQAHGARCDKKAFHERLTEALRPDPAALAKAILDKKHGRDHYPVHPMMFFGPPGMMFMRGGMRGGRW